MKQAAFDNIIKVFSLIMMGYFLFLLTKISEPREEGRYRYVDERNGLILDSKTGYLYERHTRMK